MTKKKNWVKFISLFLITIILTACLLCKNIINLEKIIEASDEFQYNVISMSAIIGGFLFTGISILISTLDKERIKRLWDNNYLDNLYRAAFVGMIANVVSIILALICLICDLSLKYQYSIICIEIMALAIGLAFFIWCIRFLLFIITRLKD